MHPRAALLLALSLLLGCGPARPPASSGSPRAPSAGDAAPRVVPGGEVRIRDEVDPVTGLAIYDAEDLFSQGLAHLQGDNPGLARVLFARLLQEFPASPLAVPGRYNLAFSAEKQGMVRDAARLYLEYVAVIEASDPLEAAEQRLHVGELCFEHGLFTEAVIPLETARSSGQLDVTDEWLAKALLARIAGLNGSWKLAESELEDLRRAIRRRTRATRELFPWSSAMVWFHAASLYSDRARSQRLLDVDDLTAARAWLDETAHWFLEARRCYKRVLEHRHPDWSGAAALALGAINEDFRRAMLAADTPSSLDGEGTQVYLALLEEQTRAFLGKAVQDYRWLLLESSDLRIEGEDLVTLGEALRRVERELEPEQGTATAP